MVNRSTCVFSETFPEWFQLPKQARFPKAVQFWRIDLRRREFSNSPKIQRCAMRQAITLGFCCQLSVHCLSLARKERQQSLTAHRTGPMR